MIKVGIGQDSHRFNFKSKSTALILGGYTIPNAVYGLDGNSDADVVLHSLTNAISSITTVNILGKIADNLCKEGITDSKVYLKEALKYLEGYGIEHIAISIECLVPKLSEHIEPIRGSVASICNINLDQVGCTATSGENLTPFGQGAGISSLVILTVKKQLIT